MAALLGLALQHVLHVRDLAELVALQVLADDLQVADLGWGEETGRPGGSGAGGLSRRVVVARSPATASAQFPHQCHGPRIVRLGNEEPLPVDPLPLVLDGGGRVVVTGDSGEDGPDSLVEGVVVERSARLQVGGCGVERGVAGSFRIAACLAMIGAGARLRQAAQVHDVTGNDHDGVPHEVDEGRPVRDRPGGERIEHASHDQESGDVGDELGGSGCPVERGQVGVGDAVTFRDHAVVGEQAPEGGASGRPDQPAQLRDAEPEEGRDGEVGVGVDQQQVLVDRGEPDRDRRAGADRIGAAQEPVGDRCGVHAVGDNRSDLAVQGGRGGRVATHP